MFKHLKLGKYFYALFIVGLLIRLGLSYHMGNHDMVAYMGWGQDVLEKGLLKGYYGIYFPVQYQLFSLYSWIRLTLSLRPILVFKAFNLLFDIGVFGLLVRLLAKFKVSRNYALIFWLHPWFLLVYSQGFVDMQFTFFVLLSILLLFKRDKGGFDYLVSGVPLAVAFLQKPQVSLPLFALFVFFSLFSITHKTWKNLLFFVPSGMLFIFYSIYFAIASSNFINGLLTLPRSYLDTINALPCLTCSMPNFWYPFATFLSKGHAVYTVTSRIFIFPGITIERTALLIVILIIIYFCYLLLKSKGNDFAEKTSRLILFVSLLVPFLMTNSHVNHGYLGSVLLIIYTAKYVNKWFRLAGHLLLIAFAGFLYVSYGFGENFAAVPNFVRHIPLVYFSLITIPAFVYILYYVFKVTVSKARQFSL